MEVNSQASDSHAVDAEVDSQASVSDTSADSEETIEEGSDYDLAPDVDPVGPSSTSCVELPDSGASGSENVTDESESEWSET